MKNMHKLLFALALAASMTCGAATEKVGGAEECASVPSNATLRVGTYNAQRGGTTGVACGQEIWYSIASFQNRLMALA